MQVFETIYDFRRRDGVVAGGLRTDAYAGAAPDSHTDVHAGTYGNHCSDGDTNANSDTNSDAYSSADCADGVAH